MIFKSPGRGHSATVVTQKSLNFWQENSQMNAILPFPYNFHHNSPGAKYFFEDLLHPFMRKLVLYLTEATLHFQ